MWPATSGMLCGEARYVAMLCFSAENELQSACQRDIICQWNERLVCVPACARLASRSRLRADSPASQHPLGTACGQAAEVATVRPGARVQAATLRLIRQGCWQGPFSRRAKT